jgi:hypothetical protein
MKLRAFISVAGVAVCLAAFLSGCISLENDRDTVGRGLKLEAFESPRAPEQAVVPADLVAPSVVAIERDNWQKTEILVPVDGTAHRPTYSRREDATNKSRRQRELYPTATSSLELSAGSEGQQQSEAFYNVARALSDIVFLPFRMLWRAPWRTDVSPEDAYVRYGHPELAPGQRPPLPEDTDPFAQPAPRSVTP